MCWFNLCFYVFLFLIINHVSYCLPSLETSIREVEHENPSGKISPSTAQFFASTNLNRDVKNHHGNITNTYPSRCLVMSPACEPSGRQHRSLPTTTRTIARSAPGAARWPRLNPHQFRAKDQLPDRPFQLRSARRQLIQNGYS